MSGAPKLFNVFKKHLEIFSALVDGDFRDRVGFPLSQPPQKKALNHSQEKEVPYKNHSNHYHDRR